MKKKFLTVAAKLQKKRKIRYKVVNRKFMRIIVFPEEKLIQKTKAIHNSVCTPPKRKRKVHSNNKSNILKRKLNKRRALNSIQEAVENYENFPLNQAEYVQLLWDAIDKIEEVVQHLIPIVNSSTHNNLMRCLYTILLENKENLIKLLEYEVEPISKFHFEKICLNLMDNTLTCNRVLLACCYAQNSYQQVNKHLENLIVLIEHFEMIIAFVSKAILRSQGCDQNYIPSGRVIRHLKCSICDTVVSLAGCYCTNWDLDTLSVSQTKLFRNPLEDGPSTSSTYCIMSWDVALYYLKNLPPPEKYQPPRKFTNRQKTKFVKAPIVLRVMNKKWQPKPKKRKGIDEVWLKNKISGILNVLREPPRKSNFKRKAGNDVWLIKELNSILDKISPCKLERISLKRKAEEPLDDFRFLHKINNIIPKDSNLSRNKLFEE